MSLLDILGWVGSALNLLGAYRVTHKDRSGFLIFAFSCVIQIPGLMSSHVWSQVALLAAYVFIDITGYLRWGSAVTMPLTNCYIECVD